MQAGLAALIVVPGVVDEFLDAGGILRVHLVHAGKVAVEDDAAGELEAADVGEAVGRQVTVAEVVLHAAADRGPVEVRRGDGEEIGDVDLFDEPLGLLEETADHREPLGIEGVGLLDVDGAGDAAHEIVRVRVLAAKDRVDLDDLLLPLEGLEVVRDADQVHGGRQLVGRVAPVAVGEDAELAALDELGQALLQVAEVAR